MGTDKADVGDRAADGNHRPGHQGCHSVDSGFDARDGDAKNQGVFLACGNEIQTVGAGVEQGKAREHGDRDHVNRRVYRTAQVADEPIENPAQVRLIGAGQEKHVDGREEGREDDACQEQPLRGLSGARVASNDVHGRNRACRSQEGRQRPSVEKTPARVWSSRRSDKNGIQNGPQRRAGRDSKHVRIGQRIAQQRLECGAGRGESGPDKRSHQDPRETHGKQDRGQLRFPVILKNAQHLAGGDRNAADVQRHECGQKPGRQQPQGFPDYLPV